MKHKHREYYRSLLITINTSYAVVIILLWSDELFDLPYLLGLTAKTPINLYESLFESIAVIIVWIISTSLCRRLLQRINVLEGILPICSACKKIRNSSQNWQEIESYVCDKTEVEFSHSLCPDCLKKLYPDMAEEIIDRTHVCNNKEKTLE